MNEVPPKVRQKLLGFTLDYQQEQIIRIIHIRFFILLFHTDSTESTEIILANSFSTIWFIYKSARENRAEVKKRRYGLKYASFEFVASR